MAAGWQQIPVFGKKQQKQRVKHIENWWILWDFEDILVFVVQKSSKLRPKSACLTITLPYWTITLPYFGITLPYWTITLPYSKLLLQY